GSILSVLSNAQALRECLIGQTDNFAATREPNLPKSTRPKSRRPARESTEERFLRIHSTIRQRICLLDYTPGSALSEVDLPREFKVSRTPLRRVLQRLDYEGLVHIRNGVGTIVTDINLKVLKDTYDLRIRHALMVGELSSVPIASADIRALDALIKRMHT